MSEGAGGSEHGHLLGGSAALVVVAGVAVAVGLGIHPVPGMKKTQAQLRSDYLEPAIAGLW